MANPILRGDLAPYLQNSGIDYDPVRGITFFADYHGLSQVYMQNVQNDLIKDGIACRLTFLKGGDARLEAQDSTQQYVLDSWQIVGSNLSVDGLSHPTVIGIRNVYLSAGDVVAEMRQGLLTEAEYDTLPGNGLNAAGDADDDTLGRFYALQQRGSTDFRDAHYILRHTTNIPNRFNAALTNNNIEFIYQNASLITEISNGALWFPPCPNYILSLIAGIPVPTPQQFYQWGWLKNPCIATTAVNNRVNVEQEYELALWSTDYYPNII